MNNTNNRLASATGSETVDSNQLERLRRLVLHLRDCSADQRRGLAAEIDSSGEVFAAFLLHADGVDVTSASLIEDFEDRYRDTFGSWQETAAELGEIFGWPAALTDLKDDGGEPMAELLAWDDAAVRARLAEHFVLLAQEDGRVHVFDRAR